jgi:membrane-associated protease RseP (regulator of RpoE activity)
LISSISLVGVDVLLYVLGIVFVLVGIALSIGLHELGHFLPAKRFGVSVRQFMIGFGPTVYSKQRGETEFGFKALPLGGYILMEGMYPPAQKPYRGLFANWIREARKEIDEQQVAVALDQQFHQLSTWKKITIMLGGPMMNFFLGVVLIATALSGIGTLQNSLTVQQVYACVDAASDGSCPAGAPQSPALAAGMQAGDRVVSVNGVGVANWSEVTDLMAERGQAPSALVVLRDGANTALIITPVFMERAVYDDQGSLQLDSAGVPITELRPILGIRLEAETKPMPLADSLGYSLNATAAMFGFIADLPAQVYQVFASTFGTAERDPYGAVSVVGVGQLAGELTAADIGVDAKLASLLMLLGSLNIALFAFNLVPLLPLDGGHVAGALYEGAKRRIVKATTGKDPGPVDTAKALPIAYIVWLLLIVTGMVLILADLVNPITLG